MGQEEQEEGLTDQLHQIIVASSFSPLECVLYKYPFSTKRELQRSAGFSEVEVSRASRLGHFSIGP